MNNKPNNHKKSQRGQSLVEVALFLPIFIILLAGLVEVSQLLITQNRISSAARAGTRFASNGGENIGVVDVVLNTVTQTLETDESLWDLWVIRGTVNDAGDAIDDADWEFVHEYGISNTVRFESVDETLIKSRILAELQQDENKNIDPALAADLKFVATYAIHDVNSILGLNALPQFDGFMSRDALSVMRITADGNEVTNGCAAFPIAIRKGIRSVNPPNTGTAYDYPNANDFTYPSTNQPAYNQFIHHIPDRPLEEAQEGWLFRIYNGSGSGNFGWLHWNQAITANAPNLADSLAWPGNSTDYIDYGDSVSNGNLGPINGWGGDYIPRGYIEPGNVTDQALHVGDFVPGDTGVVNSRDVRDTLAEHIALDRTLRVIVWETATGTGNNTVYTIESFAVFRLIGYNLSQNWILAEFIRWDNSCGQNPGGS